MKNQKYSGIEYGDNNDELLSEMSIEYDKSEDVWVKPLVEKQEVFEKSTTQITGHVIQFCCDFKLLEEKCLRSVPEFVSNVFTCYNKKIVIKFKG